MGLLVDRTQQKNKSLSLSKPQQQTQKLKNKANKDKKKNVIDYPRTVGQLKRCKDTHNGNTRGEGKQG